MFSKGAPESILSRCAFILLNGDGSDVPLTAAIRSELESRFNRKISVLLCLWCENGLESEHEVENLDKGPVFMIATDMKACRSIPAAILFSFKNIRWKALLYNKLASGSGMRNDGLVPQLFTSVPGLNDAASYTAETTSFLTS